MKTRDCYLCLALIAVLLFCLSGCTTSDTVSEEAEPNVNVVVPAWAPPYDDIQLVRYYYMPDIEVFYDVWNQEFVYLQDGTWMFTTSLPPLYAGFDPYDAYVVVLNERVYEPWMHFHYYVSHYPRYYYYSVYNVRDTRDVRGFNENREAPIRPTADQKARILDASKNRPEREKVQIPGRDQVKPPPTRPPVQVHYYGEDVGRPVKVEKQMMRPRGSVRTK